MRTASTLVCAGALALTALGNSPLSAQPATTVQLPTFQFFTVSTTVLVPDQGSTVIGGQRQRSLGSSFYSNPFLGPVRSAAANTSGSQIQISAQIHDMQAMDEALLAKWGPPKSTATVATGPSGTSISTADLPPVGSVAEAARARQAELAAADREARGYYEQGLRAEADGKPSLARAYYQMAAAKASPAFKEDVLRRVAGLSRTGAVSQVRSQP